MEMAFGIHLTYRLPMKVDFQVSLVESVTIMVYTTSLATQAAGGVVQRKVILSVILQLGFDLLAATRPMQAASQKLSEWALAFVALKIRKGHEVMKE